MIANDGGPAFPSDILKKLSEFTVVPGKAPGMSLRDYLAAKALQGILANQELTAHKPKPELVAQHAYEMADAMLAARGSTEKAGAEAVQP